MYPNVQGACVIAVVLVLVVLLLMLSGRKCKMSANSVDYEKMFGIICDGDVLVWRAILVHVLALAVTFRMMAI